MSMQLSAIHQMEADTHGSSLCCLPLTPYFSAYNDGVDEEEEDIGNQRGVNE